MLWDLSDEELRRQGWVAVMGRLMLTVLVMGLIAGLAYIADIYFLHAEGMPILDTWWNPVKVTKSIQSAGVRMFPQMCRTIANFGIGFWCMWAVKRHDPSYTIQKKNANKWLTVLLIALVAGVFGIKAFYLIKMNYGYTGLANLIYQVLANILLTISIFYVCMAILMWAYYWIAKAGGELGACIGVPSLLAAEFFVIVCLIIWALPFAYFQTFDLSYIGDASYAEDRRWYALMGMDRVYYINGFPMVFSLINFSLVSAVAVTFYVRFRNFVDTLMMMFLIFGAEYLLGNGKYYLNDTLTEDVGAIADNWGATLNAVHINLTTSASFVTTSVCAIPFIVAAFILVYRMAGRGMPDVRSK